MPKKKFVEKKIKDPNLGFSDLTTKGGLKTKEERATSFKRNTARNKKENIQTAVYKKENPDTIKLNDWMHKGLRRQADQEAATQFYDPTSHLATMYPSYLHAEDDNYKGENGQVDMLTSEYPRLPKNNKETIKRKLRKAKETWGEDNEYEQDFIKASAFFGLNTRRNKQNQLEYHPFRPIHKTKYRGKEEDRERLVHTKTKYFYPKAKWGTNLDEDYDPKKNEDHSRTLYGKKWVPDPEK